MNKVHSLRDIESKVSLSKVENKAKLSRVRRKIKPITELKVH